MSTEVDRSDELVFTASDSTADGIVEAIWVDLGYPSGTGASGSADDVFAAKSRGPAEADDCVDAQPVLMVLADQQDFYYQEFG